MCVTGEVSSPCITTNPPPSSRANTVRRENQCDTVSREQYPRCLPGRSAAQTRDPYPQTCRLMIEPQIQVIPLRVQAFNRIDLPDPAPSLHLLLPADRVIHIPELLKVNQLRNTIFRGKATPNLAFMLINPPRKIIRHASIKRPTRLTRQYVHEVRHGSSLATTTRSHNHPNTPSSFEGPPHRSWLNGREDTGVAAAASGQPLAYTGSSVRHPSIAPLHLVIPRKRSATREPEPHAQASQYGTGYRISTPFVRYDVGDIALRLQQQTLPH